jgi:hypothetical protein
MEVHPALRRNAADAVFTDPARAGKVRSATTSRQSFLCLVPFPVLGNPFQVPLVFL